MGALAYSLAPPERKDASLGLGANVEGLIISTGKGPAPFNGPRPLSFTKPQANTFSTAKTTQLTNTPNAGMSAVNTIAPKGWNVGDDIYSLTKAGNEPAWSTVRGRFWKNEAAAPPYGTWDADQLARMQQGLAPQRFNLDKGGIESMDLSHEPVPIRNGGKDIVPKWPQELAAGDPYRRPGY